VVTSQACEKIYGALGDPAQVRADITLEGATRLEWLPQPMIFFDGARLRRETRVEMAADASLLAVEGVVFGRAAMGESVERGELSDALTIRRGGRLVHVDRFDVKDEIGRMLDRQTVLDGNRAMATTRYVASDAEARLDEMRGLLEGSACPAAVSAWNGMMLMRHVAPDSYTLNKELIRVLSAFRKEPMPRVWSI
jgi:urease accessory protein